MKSPLTRARAGLAIAACVAALVGAFAAAQQSAAPSAAAVQQGFEPSDPLEYFAERHV